METILSYDTINPMLLNVPNIMKMIATDLAIHIPLCQIYNADKSDLQQLLKMAEEGCPAIYSMSHIINVEATIT